MENLRLREVNSILASMTGADPDKVAGWVLVVAVDNEDGSEGILTASPANVEGIPEEEARIANIVALSWALHTLSTGYMSLTYPDYKEHIEALVEVICETCRMANHEWCIGPSECDCQHGE